MVQYNDDKLKELWPKLRSKIPHFFEGIVVEPALLHGDLWSGNMGEDENGPGIINKIICRKVVIFPPP